MQVLNDFKVFPKLNFHSKKYFEKKFGDIICGVARGERYDILEFEKLVAQAKGRGLNILKLKINVNFYDTYGVYQGKFDPYTLTLMNFFNNEKAFSNMLYYLTKNTNFKKYPNVQKEALSNLFYDNGEDVHYKYKNTKTLSRQFKAVFNMLKANGASLDMLAETLSFYDCKIFKSQELVDFLKKQNCDSLNNVIDNKLKTLEDIKFMASIADKKYKKVSTARKSKATNIKTIESSMEK